MTSDTPHFDAALLKLAEAAEDDDISPAVFLKFFDEEAVRAEVRAFLFEHDMVTRQMRNSSFYVLEWY